MGSAVVLWSPCLSSGGFSGLVDPFTCCEEQVPELGSLARVAVRSWSLHPCSPPVGSSPTHHAIRHSRSTHIRRLAPSTIRWCLSSRCVLLLCAWQIRRLTKSSSQLLPWSPLLCTRVHARILTSSGVYDFMAASVSEDAHSVVSLMHVEGLFLSRSGTKAGTGWSCVWAGSGGHKPNTGPHDVFFSGWMKIYIYILKISYPFCPLPMLLILK